MDQTKPFRPEVDLDPVPPVFSFPQKWKPICPTKTAAVQSLHLPLAFLGFASVTLIERPFS
jgi:hypothetical protein